MVNLKNKHFFLISFKGILNVFIGILNIFICFLIFFSRMSFATCVWYLFLFCYLRGIFGVSSGEVLRHYFRKCVNQSRKSVNLFRKITQKLSTNFMKRQRHILTYFYNSKLLHYYIITYFYESIYSIYSIFHPKYFAQTSQKIDDFWGV